MLFEIISSYVGSHFISFYVHSVDKKCVSLLFYVVNTSRNLLSQAAFTTSDVV